MLILNGEKQGSGIDTSDATATADDISAGKTAYVNGSEVTGTAEIVLLSPAYSYEVKNSSAEIISSGSGKGNYTRNAFNMIACNVALCSKSIIVNTAFADGYVNIKDDNPTIGTTYIYRYNATSQNAVVMVGTQTTAESIDAYAPLTSGLTLSGSSTAVSAFSDGVLTTTLTATYVNSTGSAVNISEIGVRTLGSGFTLMIRDLIDTVEVPNGGSITCTYVTKVAYITP